MKKISIAVASAILTTATPSYADIFSYDISVINSSSSTIQFSANSASCKVDLKLAPNNSDTFTCTSQNVVNGNLHENISVSIDGSDSQKNIKLSTDSDGLIEGDFSSNGVYISNGKLLGGNPSQSDVGKVIYELTKDIKNSTFKFISQTVLAGFMRRNSGGIMTKSHSSNYLFSVINIPDPNKPDDPSVQYYPKSYYLTGTADVNTQCGNGKVAFQTDDLKTTEKTDYVKNQKVEITNYINDMTRKTSDISFNVAIQSFYFDGDGCTYQPAIGTSCSLDKSLLLECGQDIGTLSYDFNHMTATK